MDISVKGLCFVRQILCLNFLVFFVVVAKSATVQTMQNAEKTMAIAYVCLASWEKIVKIVSISTKILTKRK